MPRERGGQGEGGGEEEEAGAIPGYRERRPRKHYIHRRRGGGGENPDRGRISRTARDGGRGMQPYLPLRLTAFSSHLA